MRGTFEQANLKNVSGVCNRKKLAACFHVGFSSRSLSGITANIEVLGTSVLKNSEATYHLTCIAKMKE